jgi:hypothetical protein
MVDEERRQLVHMLARNPAQLGDVKDPLPAGTPMSALMLLISLEATPDCAAFASRVSEPLEITAAQIPGAALAGTVANAPGVGERPRFRVGELFYRGYGLAITSSDPRFEAVSTRPDRSARHPCGYSLDWPSGWNAYDVRKTALTTNFAKAPREGDPGSSMAVQRQAPSLFSKASTSARLGRFFSAAARFSSA